MYFMKEISKIIGIAFIFIMGSCATKNDKFAQVTGTYKGVSKDVQVQLYRVDNGTKKVVATSGFGEGGYFSFTYSVTKPGIFIVDVMPLKQEDKNRTVLRVLDYGLKRFYLENGTEIEIEFKGGGGYTLLNTNSEKNELLSEWNNLVDTVYSYSNNFSSTYEAFFPLLPDFVKQADEFKNRINTRDEKFNDLIKLLVDTEMSNCALYFLQTPRRIHPTKDIYPDFYEGILEDGAPKSDRLLELPIGLNYLSSYVIFKAGFSDDIKNRGNIEFNISYIPNDLLKGYYLLENLYRFRTYDDNYIKFRRNIDKYIKNDYLKKGFDDYEKSIRKYEKGSIPFDIKGTDVKGIEHKLSDYKGKVVYVDIWATWCGPCKAQIPALKKLEKKFHGKSIVFLSVSIDKAKDKAKWKEFVKKEKLKGVQLISDEIFKDEFMKAYDIKGIPRFMLFDKQGKVVTIDALRPTNEKIEGILNNLI